MSNIKLVCLLAKDGSAVGGVFRVEGDSSLYLYPDILTLIKHSADNQMQVEGTDKVLSVLDEVVDANGKTVKTNKYLSVSEGSLHALKYVGLSRFEGTATYDTYTEISNILQKVKGDFNEGVIRVGCTAYLTSNVQDLREFAGKFVNKTKVVRRGETQMMHTFGKED